MAKAQNEGKQVEDPLEVARIENERLRIMAEAEKAQLEYDIKLQEIGIKDLDIQAKVQQANNRLQEAKIKAMSEVKKSQIDSTSKQVDREKDTKPPEINLPEIHVNIDKSGNSKTITIEKNKEGKLSGTIKDE